MPYIVIDDPENPDFPDPPKPEQKPTTEALLAEVLAELRESNELQRLLVRIERARLGWDPNTEPAGHDVVCTQCFAGKHERCGRKDRENKYRLQVACDCICLGRRDL